VLPDLRELESDPRAAGFAAVISGHSHQPYVREENGVLYLNPASAGPRRFGLLVSVAEIPVGERLEARLIELDV
jgi:predicted phosphodiesterase